MSSSDALEMEGGFFFTFSPMQCRYARWVIGVSERVTACASVLRFDRRRVSPQMMPGFLACRYSSVGFDRWRVSQSSLSTCRT